MISIIIVIDDHDEDVTNILGIIVTMMITIIIIIRRMRMKECGNYCVQHTQQRPHIIIIATTIIIIIIIICRWETQRKSAKTFKQCCQSKLQIQSQSQKISAKACSLFHLDSLSFALVFFCIAHRFQIYYCTRSLRALWAPTFEMGPLALALGPLKILALCLGHSASAAWRVNTLAS